MQYKIVDYPDKVSEITFTFPVWKSGEDESYVPTFVGVVEGDNYYLANQLYLSYKDSWQVGAPVIYIDSKEELEEICEKLGVSVIEYPRCVVCHKVIFGCHTLDDDGEPLCVEHEDDIKIDAII